MPPPSCMKQQPESTIVDEPAPPGAAKPETVPELVSLITHDKCMTVHCVLLRECSWNLWTWRETPTDTTAAEGELISQNYMKMALSYHMSVCQPVPRLLHQSDTRLQIHHPAFLFPLPNCPSAQPQPDQPARLQVSSSFGLSGNSVSVSRLQALDLIL